MLKSPNQPDSKYETCYKLPSAGSEYKLRFDPLLDEWNLYYRPLDEENNVMPDHDWVPVTIPKGLTLDTKEEGKAFLQGVNEGAIQYGEREDIRRISRRS